MDFGKARGTPYYMSPEVLQGSLPTPKSDIWSFGATLLHLLTGAPPWHSFKCRSFPELRATVLEATRETGGSCCPPLGGWENPSTDMLTVIHSCFQINPADRPDATELCKISLFGAESVRIPPYADEGMAFGDFKLLGDVRYADPKKAAAKLDTQGIGIDPSDSFCSLAQTSEGESLFDFMSRPQTKLRLKTESGVNRTSFKHSTRFPNIYGQDTSSAIDGSSVGVE